MRVTRRGFCVSAGAMALAGPRLARAQESGGDLLRFTFAPPLDQDLVQSIETISYLRVGETERITRWSHEVVLRMTERKEPDEYVGSFHLRNIVNIEGADTDIAFLIARAIEGETYPLVMLDYGIVLETDWPDIQQRITSELPKLTDATTASTILAVLPHYADGVDAVLRPTTTTGLSHLIGFRRDGASHLRDDIGKLTYLGIEKATVESSGGKDPERDNALAVFWLVTPDPQAATDVLGPELLQLASAVDANMGTESRTTLTAAIADGIEASEYGNALYDAERGVMREVVFDVTITAKSIERVLRYKVTLSGA